MQPTPPRPMPPQRPIPGAQQPMPLQKLPNPRAGGNLNPAYAKGGSVRGPKMPKVPKVPGALGRVAGLGVPKAPPKPNFEMRAKIPGGMRRGGKT